MSDARHIGAPVVFQALDAALVEMVLRQQGGAAWHRNRQKWLRYLDEHDRGLRRTLIAVVEGQAAAYGSLVLRSRYEPFRRDCVPEIADLVVAEPRRGVGIGRRLIALLEGEAEKRGFVHVGIGVGLYKDYGPAQRLYASLGFVMDGNGLTAGLDAKAALPGSRVTVDDDLLIWMTKSIVAGFDASSAQTAKA